MNLIVDSVEVGRVAHQDVDHKVLLQVISAKHANAIAVTRDGAYLAVGDAARVTIWKLN